MERHLRCQSVSIQYSLDHQSSLFALRKLGLYERRARYLGFLGNFLEQIHLRFHSSHHKIGKEDRLHGEG